MYAYGYQVYVCVDRCRCQVRPRACMRIKGGTPVLSCDTKRALLMWSTQHCAVALPVHVYQHVHHARIDTLKRGPKQETRTHTCIYTDKKHTSIQVHTLNVDNSPCASLQRALAEIHRTTPRRPRQAYLYLCTQPARAPPHLRIYTHVHAVLRLEHVRALHGFDRYLPHVLRTRRLFPSRAIF